MGRQITTASPSFAWKAIWTSLLADGYKMAGGWLQQQVPTAAFCHCFSIGFPLQNHCFFITAQCGRKWEQEKGEN
ncbi:hypothetical protein [Botryobacter ruber]|uniref:hypothetical protein n=1 Tax=Botryobacter ruber TaxID=2171629 RepID=UPI000F64E17C|nr:hypothetical protein [Botryobacter ruber]